MIREKQSVSSKNMPFSIHWSNSSVIANKPNRNKIKNLFKVKQESEKDPFAIALAISSPNGYKSANFAEMLAIGTFSMTYLITGGAEDGKTFDIQSSLKCSHFSRKIGFVNSEHLLRFKNDIDVQ